MDINARRHPQPFEPGELVFVRLPSYMGNQGFDPNERYEIKDGPDANGAYKLWTDNGVRGWERVNEHNLVPAEPVWTRVVETDDTDED